MNHLRTAAAVFLAYTVTLLSNTCVHVNAVYPSTLMWSDCGQDKCATLEFCNNGSNYGKSKTHQIVDNMSLLVKFESFSSRSAFLLLHTTLLCCLGYRNPGDITPCGSKPGPLIRMAPGTTYKLTLQNSADDSSVSTNIHTHGLHITGSGDGDDITRFVSGGDCLDYTWDIPSDHPGGTNWYHSHYHTLTNDQTQSGAFGMMIIDDDYSRLNSWAHPRNELLLLVSNMGSSVLGNGNRNEVFQVQVGKWYRLRVSAVEPFARTAALSFHGGSCTVYKVASDGIWHNAALTTYSGSSFDMTGASRADYAISCNSVGATTIKWGRGDAATIEAGKFDSNTGSIERDLGNAPPKPTSLTGLGTTSPDGTFVISMSDVDMINGQSWDEDVPLGAIRYDGIYEWTIIGTGAHPYHQYLYPMLIVEPGGCGLHEEGEFYDTISAPDSCRVRFYAIDIGQRMVLVSTCRVIDIFICIKQSLFSCNPYDITAFSRSRPRRKRSHDLD